MSITCKICGSANEEHSKLCSGCFRPLENANEVNNFQNIKPDQSLSVKELPNLVMNDRLETHHDNSFQNKEQDLVINRGLGYFISNVIFYAILFSLVFTLIGSLIHTIIGDQNQIATVIVNAFLDITVYTCVIKRTFSKAVPKQHKINVTLFTIFVMFIMYGSMSIYLNSFTINTSSIINFYAMSSIYILILSLIFTNYAKKIIYQTIQSDEESKFIFNLNIIISVLIIIILIIGYFYSSILP